jgi:hypothetical protein
LSIEQFDKYMQLERDRQSFGYGAKIEMALVEMAVAMRPTKLRDDQRLQLVELLLKESKPPKKSVNSNLDYHFVMLQMAKIPEDKLKPLFDDAQWHVLRRSLDQAKAMEQQLRQVGMLE